MDPCLHKASRLVKVVASNGTEMFACQCVRCGGKSTQWIPKKIIKYPSAVPDENSKTPTLSELLAEERIRIRADAEVERARLSQARVEFYFLRRTLYDNYLKSPQWQSLRRAIFARSGGICEKCKIRTATQGHHLTYERLGNENLADLLAVCRQCHEELHKKEEEATADQIGSGVAA